MKQIVKLRVGGERFDGIGLDLESSEVPDIALRNRRTVAFAKQVRKLVGASVPVAAIVYPAVQLEVLNTTLWPDFPYAAVEPLRRSLDADELLHVPGHGIGAAQRVPLHRRQRRPAAQAGR